MEIGLLLWDSRGTDTDEGAFIDGGTGRGHRVTTFTLADIGYVPRQRGGFDVRVAGADPRSFDAIISRAELYGEDWRDRVERLTLLGEVPGVRLFDPVLPWVRGYSKLQCTQRLGAAGFPVPPTRSATCPADVELACREWGTVVVKPSFEYAGTGVEQITDPAAQAGLIGELLDQYGTLAAMPYWPTEYGEYRLTVAGDTCVSMFKLPPAGTWRCKTYQGASWERIDAPADLTDLAFRATRAMELSISGVDALPTGDGGWVILEVNPVPGQLALLGARARAESVDGLYAWVEQQVSAGPGPGPR